MTNKKVPLESDKGQQAKGDPLSNKKFKASPNCQVGAPERPAMQMVNLDANNACDKEDLPDER